MEKEIKSLKGGEIYYTEKNGGLFRVSSGEILVYIIPFENGKARRRMYLGSFGEGTYLPGISDTSPDGTKWTIGFVALNEGVFESALKKAGEDEILSFCEKTGIELGRDDSVDIIERFFDAVVEHYERNEVSEEVYIYATEHEAQRNKSRLSTLIKESFGKNKSDIKRPDVRETGNLLYDAMAFLCNIQDIGIAQIEKITASCGRRFQAKDIARVSHFAIRDIVLEDKWYRCDSGPFLAFRKESGEPVACIPRGAGRYSVYDPSDGSIIKVNGRIASEIGSDAYMLYPPFPQKSMKLGDIISFGMKYVYRSDITRLLLLAFLGTLTGLLIPYMNELAYDKFIPTGDSHQMKELGAILIACSLGNVSFTVVKNLATFRSMNSMKYAVQSAAFDRLFNLPESFYRDYESAELGQRVMGISGVYQILTNGVMLTLFSTLFSLLYLVRMNQYSKDLTKLAVTMTFTVVVIIVLLSRIHFRYEGKRIKIDIDAQSELFQYISGVSKIRISSTEDRALLNYLEEMIASQELTEKEGKITLFSNTIIQSVNIVFSLFMYYTLVDKKISLSIGMFSAFMSAFTAFSTAMMTLANQMFIINQVIPIYKNAKPILESLPENSEQSRVPGELKGELEINSVSFSYKKDDDPVIKNFNLHVMPGEYIGIVGASGCGKSTLLKLLLGFEKPQTGKIYYDNQDIDDLDKRELRKKFGVVLQEGGIITGSIRDNIIITSPYVKNERIEEAIREVGLEEDIKDMPMGLFTVVSEGAGTLSGGQRQRILIARAIVGKPKMIFLDEATSALDNKTQNQVVETLERLDATKIVIAHRLSTVQNCDRIIVMDKGCIAEQGSYRELMEKKGLFYELAKRQIS
ncbi:MAG: NHLP bacteriocin export ABC transporter permease/ATPase subunit [Lachnospiraceae bacterium]|nr:NHLP bacteriocin export ABC transporter permease/ATPase subunit [Lachnospiraceae bacterium]